MILCSIYILLKAFAIRSLRIFPTARGRHKSKIKFKIHLKKLTFIQCLGEGESFKQGNTREDLKIKQL